MIHDNIDIDPEKFIQYLLSQGWTSEDDVGGNKLVMLLSPTVGYIGDRENVTINRKKKLSDSLQRAFHRVLEYESYISKVSIKNKILSEISNIKTV